MIAHCIADFCACLLVLGLFSIVEAQSPDGRVLPFPPTPSTGEPGETILDSTMTWRKQPERLRPDAPNVLIVLLDDVGFAQTDTFGGEVYTPTLPRLANEGVSYNRFHTTSICSPTR